MAPNPWTSARVELLRKHWQAGLSCTAIAAQLGKPITRNSVIGKAHRLGLATEGAVRKPIARVKSPRGEYPPTPHVHGHAKPTQAALLKQALEKLPKPSVDHPKGMRRKHLETLEDDECRFGVDEDHKGHIFCGLPRFASAPYCIDHCLRAFVSPTQKSAETPLNAVSAPVNGTVAPHETLVEA